MAQITGKELAELNEKALSDDNERAARASDRLMRLTYIADAQAFAATAAKAGDIEDSIYWTEEVWRISEYL